MDSAGTQEVPEIPYCALALQRVLCLWCGRIYFPGLCANLCVADALLGLLLGYLGPGEQDGGFLELVAQGPVASCTLGSCRREHTLRRAEPWALGLRAPTAGMGSRRGPRAVPSLQVPSVPEAAWGLWD